MSQSDLMFVLLQICPQAIGPDDLHDPIDVIGVDVSRERLEQYLATYRERHRVACAELEERLSEYGDDWEFRARSRARRDCRQASHLRHPRSRTRRNIRDPRGRGGMRTLVLVLVLAAPAALAGPQPKPPGPGGSCPHGWTSSGSFCAPGQGVPDAIAKPANATCPVGWTSSGSYCLRSGSGGR